MTLHHTHTHTHTRMHTHTHTHARSQLHPVLRCEHMQLCVVSIPFCLKSLLAFFSAFTLLSWLSFNNWLPPSTGHWDAFIFHFYRHHRPSSSAENICVDDMSYIVFTLSALLVLNVGFELVKHLSDKQTDIKAKWQKDERTRCRLLHSSCHYELPDQSIVSAGLSAWRQRRALTSRAWLVRRQVLVTFICSEDAVKGALVFLVACFDQQAWPFIVYAELASLNVIYVFSNGGKMSLCVENVSFQKTNWSQRRNGL